MNDEIKKAARYPGTMADTIHDLYKFNMEQIYKDGVICKACDSFCKVYTRSISYGMARSIIRLYAARRQELTHTPSFLSKFYPEGADFTKLEWWGLIEKPNLVRDDGSKRVGMWRVTNKGVQFAKNKINVWNKLLEYHSEVIGTPKEAKKVVVIDLINPANKEFFDYTEIMRPVFNQLRLF